jgi:ArsR family transcriptional regulator, arsenate/arsenite/antimonite-responsive transcriptional repressor
MTLVSMSDPQRSQVTTDPVAVCRPLGDGRLGEQRAHAMAYVLKAMADPMRLRMVNILLTCENRQATVAELTAQFALTQPTVSHHLKVLHEAGVLERTRRGVWVSYRIRPEAMRALAGVFQGPGPGA